MKISIDTKEDSQEDIKRAIRLLQNIVGDSQEVFTNEPTVTSSNGENTSSPTANIFGDTAEISLEQNNSSQSTHETQSESSESTEDLFAELFSEDEIKNMDKVKDDEDEVKPRGKKHNIELY